MIRPNDAFDELNRNITNLLDLSEDQKTLVIGLVHKAKSDFERASFKTYTTEEYGRLVLKVSALEGKNKALHRNWRDQERVAKSRLAEIKHWQKKAEGK